MEVSPFKRLGAGFIRGGNSAEVAQGKKMNERNGAVDTAQIPYLECERNITTKDHQDCASVISNIFTEIVKFKERNKWMFDVCYFLSCVELFDRLWNLNKYLIKNNNIG